MNEKLQQFVDHRNAQNQAAADLILALRDILDTRNIKGGDNREKVVHLFLEMLNHTAFVFVKP